MSTAFQIYTLLTEAGFTHAGALGMLGNWKAESGLEPNRLQGDFDAGRLRSQVYTQGVTDGSVSRAEFSRDQKGYGLAQWTYFNFQTGQGRKQNLYDFWKASGKALDSVELQVAFALHELQTEPQYAALLQLLKTTGDLYTATSQICRIYEQPYYNNTDTRYRYALSLESELALSHESPTQWVSCESDEHRSERASSDASGKRDDTEIGRNKEGGGQRPEGVSKEEGALLPTASELITPSYWPPRTVDRSMSGPDVAVAQAVLIARGFDLPAVDGNFDTATDAAVRRFQTDHSLVSDGIVGPLTWRALLQR